MSITHNHKDNNIAVYWDFENIHISLCNVHYGDKWCGQSTRKHLQPNILDVSSIMSFIASIGVININRAYANWLKFNSYSDALQKHSIDLIQLFPRTRADKNGSDIRMAIDIVEDLVQSSHIDTVVLIGGDSDYIAVSQKVRQMGKQIIGIGVQETTAPYFVNSCNEFKFYSSLLVKASSQNTNDDGVSVDITEAKSLIRKAIRTHTERTGRETILRVQLKPLLIRLEPTFDEGNYGFANFSNLLSACDDILNFGRGDHDLILSLKDGNNSDEIKKMDPYETLLFAQGIRLVDHDILQEGLICTVDTFSQGQSVESYGDYVEILRQHFVSKSIDFQPAVPRNIQNLIFKAFLFSRANENRNISLKKDYANHHVLFLDILCSLLERIIDNSTSEIETEKVAKLLLGDESKRDQIEKLIERIDTK